MLNLTSVHPFGKVREEWESQGWTGTRARLDFGDVSCRFHVRLRGGGAKAVSRSPATRADIAADAPPTPGTEEVSFQGNVAVTRAPLCARRNPKPIPYGM